MKFLVPNYSCLQNPMTKGLPPPDPRPLCHLSSTEFVETPPKKIPGYATDSNSRKFWVAPRIAVSQVCDTPLASILPVTDLIAVTERSLAEC